MQYTVYCYSKIEVFAMCWCSLHDFGASILLFGIRLGQFMVEDFLSYVV